MTTKNTGQRFSRLTFLEGFFARALGKSRSTCPHTQDEVAAKIWHMGWQHHAKMNNSIEDEELTYAQVGQLNATL